MPTSTWSLKHRAFGTTMVFSVATEVLLHLLGVLDPVRLTYPHLFLARNEVALSGPFSNSTLARPVAVSAGVDDVT